MLDDFFEGITWLGIIIVIAFFVYCGFSIYDRYTREYSVCFLDGSCIDLTSYKHNVFNNCFTGIIKDSNTEITFCADHSLVRSKESLNKRIKDHLILFWNKKTKTEDVVDVDKTLDEIWQYDN